MHSTLTRRWFLVTLIGVAQLVCLLLGEGWFVRRLEQALHHQLQTRALAQTQAAVTRTAARLARAPEASQADPTAADFLRRNIEPTGSDARIRVVDAHTGMVIADSRRAGPLPPNVHCESIVLPDGRQFPIERLPARLSEARGLMRTSDGLQWVTARLVPGLGAFVLAQKPQAEVARTVAALINTIDKAGVIIALFVSILGFLMVAAIVQAYQHRVESMSDQLEHKLLQNERQLTATRDAIVYGLAKLAESRDDDTGEHLDRIRDYVRLLADEMASTHPELDDTTIELLCVTSSLHDIGKVGIPDAVLLKHGQLTEGERAVIQKHPTIGGDCLMALREKLGQENSFLDVACEIAFAHHERWDGQGYPFGLAGEEIPLPARIVALADVYDALTTRRVYKPAISHERAAAIILQGEGTQFDPQVVRAFERCEAQFEHRSRQVGPQSPQMDAGDSSPAAPAKDQQRPDPVLAGSSARPAEDRA